MDHHSSIKTKTLTIHAATWIDGVGIIMRRKYASIYVNWDKMYAFI